MSKTTKYCVICGEKNSWHKKECKEYRNYLMNMFGSIEAIFQASDNNMLPRPPWVKYNEQGEIDEQH